MKKKLLAIAFSDLHLSIWSKFNENMERTRKGFQVLSYLSEKYPKVPALFCGDLFHKSESIDTDLLEMWQDYEPSRKCWNMIYIDGNHDLKHKNIINNPIKSLPTLLKKYWMTNLNLKSEILTGNIEVFGIPYIDDNIGVNDYLVKLIKKHKIGEKEGGKNILLLHTTYPGAHDTDGREIESPNNINPNLLNKFDLVLCGHIHKPQRLGKKVYMVGAPIQQRRTDKNCKLGYLEIYEDLSVKFIELEGFPKFIDVESEEEKKDDGNYYTVVSKKSSEPVITEHKITKKLSKRALVRRYMKAKGIKDTDKKNLLISILNKTDQ